MADSFVRVPSDSEGKRVDVSSLDVGATTVYRQRIVIGDDSATASFAVVANGALCVKVENISATAIVAGVVALTAGTANIGTINGISATVTVAGNVNLSATAIVAGVVGLTAGTAVIGDINAISRTVQVAVGTPFTLNNISATVTVAGVVGLTAGTANIGFINNISATVVVAGVVGLTAGTAVIGALDFISRTVQVAVGTPFTINNISATVTVAGNVNISATAAVGLAYVLETGSNSEVKVGDSANAAIRVNIVAGGGTGGHAITDGTSFSTQAALFTPIGGIYDDTSPNTLSENDAGVVRVTQYRAIHANLRHSDGGEVSTASALPVHVVNATTTSTVVIGNSPFTALPSASHGPKCVTASTSAAVVLIADPGASNSIYVTQIMAGNYSSTLTRARIGTSASPSYIVQPLAASGGGFVLNFDPPWKVSANSTAICSVKPNVSEVYFTVNFYVAAT